MKNYQEILEQLRKHVPGNEQHIGKRIFFWVIAIGISGALFGLIAFGAMIGILSIGLPDVSDLENLAAAQSTEIFDRDGNLLYTVHGEENRQYVPLNQIAQTIQDATIAIEDNGFYEHSGFDFSGIAMAIFHEVTGLGAQRGGSTITQQYIKNAFLSPERSYIRKLKELILAVRLERKYDKEKILELYLNRIPYGNNAYGAEKAAKIYFNKSAKDLTLAESAILAALPQAPSRYNPFGENKYSHLLKEFTEEEVFLRKINDVSDLDDEEYIRGCLGQYVTLAGDTKIYITGRSDVVLSRMETLGYVTKEQRQQAVNELSTIQFNNHRETITHPHFVLYVKELLEKKYGKDTVEKGGLKVYTTIDPTLQEYAEKIVAEKGAYNEKTYGANSAALLAIDSKTGEILAMVGSRDYYNEEIDGNVNVVIRKRQPGSAFKPFVYAQAFYNSYGPGTVIYDVPIKFGSDTPQNFDGKYWGQMTIRKALGQSRNLPAIQAYFLAGGQDYIIDLVSKMGITSLNKSHSYGYPLALGAGEIPLIEMVQGYSVFANTGKKPELTPIMKIENSNGDIIENHETKELEKVLDPQIAFLINDILSDNSIKLGSNLIIDGHAVATKTGTPTKENKKKAGGAVAPSDGLAFGYTPSITVGVWTGNADGSALFLNADGYMTAAPILKSFMTKALAGTPNEPFEEPQGIKHIAVSTTSGLLPGPNTPQAFIKEELFASFAVPTEIDNSFNKVKIDKISGKLANEYTPQVAIEEVLYITHTPTAPYEVWATAINNWYKDHPEENLPEGLAESGVKIANGFPPTEYDDIHTSETAANKPEITITAPSPNMLLPEGNFKVEVDYEAKNGISKIEFYINDDLKYTARSAPFIGNLKTPRFAKPGSKHLISAKIIDLLGYSSESVIEVKIEE